MLALVVVIGTGILVITPAHHRDAPRPVLVDATSQCPPETDSCSAPVPFACAGCSVVAGPVSNLGNNQAVYVEVTGVPAGDQIAVAFCSISQGSQPVPVVADPNCASSLPPPSSCTTPLGTPCANTLSPLEWQYITVESDTVTVSISTELDPADEGGNPIVSQNAEQYQNGTYGSFYCDNGPDFCGVEVMDIPAADNGDVVANGFPPRTAFTPTDQNTAVFPLTWAATSGGCGSAPVLQADTAYSTEQFLPAAGAATCTGTNGVAVLPTAMASVDDHETNDDCVKGTGTTCPIDDVAAGNVPVTFTDDPEDPTTLTEEKKLAKKVGAPFAYIPIAVSATEIAFTGAAGVDVSGSTSEFPVDSYELTPAMAAGVMTQLWNNPIAQLFDPDDDLCGELTGSAQCTETKQTSNTDVLVVDAKGGFQTVELKAYGYPATDTYSNGTSTGLATNYAGDTAYALLNPWPASEGNIPIDESKLGAMFPSTASGAIYETTSWMCGSAPATPFTVDLPWASTPQTGLKDIISAAQILTNAEKAPVEVTQNASGQEVANSFVTQAFEFDAKQCQVRSALPTDFGSTQAGLAGLYEPSSSPLTEAHAMDGAINIYAGDGGVAFGAMDSSQADFYGLLPASLENAAGQFVAPDQTSIDAAINDATTNKDGTLAPDYVTTDSAAYPLPMVTYALVSTAPQPTATQAQQLQDLLTNLVDYSHAGGAGYSVPMPAGYFPLPDSLYQQAITDIGKDIVAPSGSSGSSGSGGSSSSGGKGSGSAGSGSGGSGSSTSTATTSGKHHAAGAQTPTTTSSPTTPVSAAAGGVRPTLPPVSTVPVASPSLRANLSVSSPLLVSLGGARFLVPVLAALAILFVVGGQVLYHSPRLRRRLAGVTARTRGRWRRPITRLGRGRGR